MSKQQNPLDRQNISKHTEPSEQPPSDQPRSAIPSSKDDEEIVSRRHNGWSCPPHWQQLVGWLVLIIFGFFHITTIVPGIPTLPAQIVAYVVCLFCSLYCIFIYMIQLEYNWLEFLLVWVINLDFWSLCCSNCRTSDHFHNDWSSGWFSSCKRR